MQEWGYIVIGVIIGLLFRPKMINDTSNYRLMRIERKVDWLAKKSGWEDPPMDENIMQLLKAGRKLEAIKYHREAHGLGLKESKDDIDEMERSLNLHG